MKTLALQAARCFALCACVWFPAWNAQAQMNIIWVDPPPDALAPVFTQTMTVEADPAGTIGYWSWHHQLGTTAEDIIYAGPQYVGGKRIHYFSFWAKNRTDYAGGPVTTGAGFEAVFDYDDCDGVPGPCYLVSFKSVDDDWKVGKTYEYKVSVTPTTPGNFILGFYVRNLTDAVAEQYTGQPVPWRLAGEAPLRQTGAATPINLVVGVNVNENGGGNGCNPRGTGSVVSLGYPRLTRGSQSWSATQFTTFRGDAHCSTPQKSFRTFHFEDVDRVTTAACGDGGQAMVTGNDNLACWWQGDVNQSCDAACGGAERVDYTNVGVATTRTQNFTKAQCTKVMQAFGVLAAPRSWPVGTSLGCAVDNGVPRHAGKGWQSAAQKAGTQRMCACKPSAPVNAVRPRSCKDPSLMKPDLIATSGTYTVWPTGTAPGSPGRQVYCEMSDYVGSGYGIGNGWTLVANQASSGNWMPADTDLRPKSFFGSYSPSWDHATHYYLDHAAIAGGTRRLYMFRTGDGTQWCAARASQLTKANSNQDARNVTLVGGFPNNTPFRTNNLFRKGVNLEDPWFGCAGTHAQNTSSMYWGEGGSNGHTALKNPARASACSCATPAWTRTATAGARTATRSAREAGRWIATTAIERCSPARRPARCRSRGATGGRPGIGPGASGATTGSASRPAPPAARRKWARASCASARPSCSPTSSCSTSTCRA